MVNAYLARATETASLKALQQGRRNHIQTPTPHMRHKPSPVQQPHARLRSSPPLGIAVGNSEGANVGASDGTPVGAMLGNSVGKLDGSEEGSAVGGEDGTLDGAPVVGAVLGALVGCAVGLAVGDSVATQMPPSANVYPAAHVAHTLSSMQPPTAQFKNAGQLNADGALDGAAVGAAVTTHDVETSW